MVFSKELGYDPDEWEECSDSEQFMLFGFTTRMFLTLTSVILTILFFWLIEARKRLDKSNEAENLPATHVNMKKMDELEIVREKLENLGRMKETETNFSKEETEALEEWQREVARMEELRLQDLVEHVIDASGSMSDIETESQLIDCFIPADRISMKTNSAEIEQFESRGTVDQTSSLITSNKFADEAAVHSIPNIEDINLTLIANLQDAANTIVTGSERENGSICSTNGWEAPTQSEPSQKFDNKTFEFPPTTATTIEPVETERYIPIGQTAEEEALILKATDNDMMRMDEKPETFITTITNQSLLTDEERRRVIEAEMYIQDAIEYVASETRPEAPAGFVVQEEMLNNIGQSDNVTDIPVLRQLPASPEATSQMFRTNEIFEKIEEPIEIDDAMTYAPEIQSIEIPPDEASINSENLLDYFDQAAAECTDVPPLLQPKIAAENPPFTKPMESLQSISLLKSSNSFTPSGTPPRIRKRSSLLSVLGVTSTQEMLLTLTSLEDLSNAMRKAGLQSTNLIFGIDYTASNKYQGERCFQGRSLHSLDAFKENPYQQVIKIMGRILAPFATSGYIPAYGFGDVKTSDWSVFKLKPEGECRDLDELLQVYDAITPTISLSGPTNFAPLIYEAIEICEKVQNYHILVIVADGQVTNEKATRKAIVRACQYPLSIIVVGVGDGPWDMMKVFDESLPRRPWDNFHFVEFHEVMQKADSIDAGELSFAVHSLLEIPDQYNTVRQLGLLRSVPSIPEHTD